MWSYHSLNVVTKLRICTASPPLHLHTFRVRRLGIGTLPIYPLHALQWENGFCQVTCQFKLYFWSHDISLLFVIGIRQGSVNWYCSLKWLTVPVPITNEYGASVRGKPRSQRRSCAGATLSNTHPTWIILRLNQDLHSKTPVNKCLSYGTASSWH